MASQSHAWISPEEYVRLDRRSGERFEYHDGQMFAMSGGSLAHVRIQSNLVRHLGNLLEGSRCQAFAGDLRILIEANGDMTYPDVSVFCGQPEGRGAGKASFVNPVILFEVLSPSTERYDRGAKFEKYRKIPSLTEYVLLSQSELAVDLFRRQADGAWTFTGLRGNDAVLELTAAGIALEVGRIYERVPFDMAETED